jgi:hypothetical protein
MQANKKVAQGQKNQHGEANFPSAIIEGGCMKTALFHRMSVIILQEDSNHWTIAMTIKAP